MLRQGSSSRIATVVTPSRGPSGLRSSTASPVQEEIEMQPMHPRAYKSHAAISGQTELHPLQLGDSAANMSANTSNNNTNMGVKTTTDITPNTNNVTPPRRTRLTDVEMIAAEPEWGREESARAESYNPRHSNTPMRFTRVQPNPNRLSRPVGFGITQHDGTTAQIIQDGRPGLLLSAEEGRNIRPRMEQKTLSRPYFWASAITPVTAIGFGLGVFDWIMVEKTEGRIREMDRDDKLQALILLAPVSALLWAIIVVLVFIAVVGAQGGL